MKHWIELQSIAPVGLLTISECSRFPQPTFHTADACSWISGFRFDYDWWPRFCNKCAGSSATYWSMRNMPFPMWECQLFSKKETNIELKKSGNAYRRCLHSNLCPLWSPHDWFSPWTIWGTHQRRPWTSEDCSLYNLNGRKVNQFRLQPAETPLLTMEPLDTQQSTQWFANRFQCDWFADFRITFRFAQTEIGRRAARL